jgi:hypothetical protein
MVPGSQNPTPPLSACAAIGAIAIISSVAAVASSCFDRRRLMQILPQVTGGQAIVGADKDASTPVLRFWPSRTTTFRGGDLIVTRLERVWVSGGAFGNNGRTVCASVSPAPATLFPVIAPQGYLKVAAAASPPGRRNG